MFWSEFYPCFHLVCMFGINKQWNTSKNDGCIRWMVWWKNKGWSFALLYGGVCHIPENRCEQCFSVYSSERGRKRGSQSLTEHLFYCVHLLCVFIRKRAVPWQPWALTCIYIRDGHRLQKLVLKDTTKGILLPISVTCQSAREMLTYSMSLQRYTAPPPVLMIHTTLQDLSTNPWISGLVFSVVTFTARGQTVTRWREQTLTLRSISRRITIIAWRLLHKSHSLLEIRQPAMDNRHWHWCPLVARSPP